MEHVRNFFYSRTIMVETGCQNVQLASTVLRLAFDPLAINILFLMPLIYMVFQVCDVKNNLFTSLLTFSRVTLLIVTICISLVHVNL